MKVKISAYNTEWPDQFEAIKKELDSDLNDGQARCVSIEHVGSTSVPELAAKPIIDILIVIPAEDFNNENLEKFKEALAWGRCQQGYHYHGDGGIGGRWSLHVNNVEPKRSVTVVAEGSMVLRSYLTTRDILKQNAELRQEYENVKRELSKVQYDQMRQYSVRKNGIIRKILLRGGWTDAEVDARQADVAQEFPQASVADFY